MSNRRDRDRGSVLPLVLVMIVVAGLIVVPLMTYAVSVFKANNVVGERTRELEAAKGGLRVALGDARKVFVTCNNSGNLPASIIDGYNVTSNCTELEEIGPNEALGYQVPTGAVAVQLGAAVPASFSGSKAQSAAVPPYPAAGDEDWWSGQVATVAPVSGAIWMPSLPQFPATRRPATGTGDPSYAMPAAFNCRVYFPGYYPNALTLSSGRHYFTSGVYYFEQPVTITGTADVVVGYGIDEFSGSECADDIQVAANVVSGPTTFDINGGGGTWVFGKNGRLVITDTAGSGSGPRVRFNQRYAEIDRGGRVSIMTVNGDSTTTDHAVSKVSATPRSMVLNGTTPSPIAANTYVPSNASSTSTALQGLTDSARAPLQVTGLTASPMLTPTGSQRGAVIVSWDEVTGQSAGGALLASTSLPSTSAYDVTVTRGSATVLARCNPDQLVFTPGAPNRISCAITGLSTSGSSSHTVSVVARNEVGMGTTPATATFRPRTSSPVSPAATVPATPTTVTVGPADTDDAALISWAAPAPSATAPPITRYDVKAYRIYLEAPATPGPSIVREQLVGSGCTSASDALFPTDLRCVVTGLPDLVPGDGVTGNIGYRFDVTATNVIGTSLVAKSSSLTAPGSLPISFNAGGPHVPSYNEKLTTRMVVPWIPTPVIDIDARLSRVLDLSIPGYVAVPMGQIKIANPLHDPVKINGGVLAGTYNVDTWMTAGAPESTPIGFSNDIVLQRKVRIVSHAGDAASTAIVQVNEDGDGYAVNSWVIN